MATYQDLLRTPHDETLFEHFATSQLAMVDGNAGAVTPIGAAAMITNADLSLDAN
jgi:hypothetical protein